MTAINKKDFVRLKKVGAESVWSVPEYYGLSMNKVPARRITLFYGGEITMQTDGEKFKGQESIPLGQGGVRDSRFVKDEKQEFKSAFSIISSTMGIDAKSVSGNIILNYHEGHLQNIVLP